MPHVPVLPPYAHQTEALRRMRDREAFALLMGMRTGKTKVTIDEWCEKLYAGEARDLQVIAPAGVYKTWIAELDKHVPPGLRREILLGIWESGNAKSQLALDEVIRSTDPRRPRVMLVNVEALSTVVAAREACLRFLAPRKAILAVDESTSIKNKSHRTAAVHALGEFAPWRRILSGLPTPRSPLDLYRQFEFLDPAILGFRNYHAFEYRYAIKKKIRVGMRHVNIVVGYRNVEELYGKIAPHSFRVRLEDCSDVPPKLYVRREVELTPEQRRIYADLQKKFTSQLEDGSHVTPSIVVDQILKLHQVCCGHVVDEEGRVHEVPTRRLAELVQLLEEYDGKAVVWCSYHHSLHGVAAKLRRAFGEQSVAMFWGGNMGQREEESRRFKSDPDCRFMVATPGAGGRGRTWSEAGLLVYYSSTNNLEHRDQSEERASGVGKTDRVTVVDLVSRGTVEDQFIGALRDKMDLAALVTGDRWREWLI
jgi:SNF2 family DNA or RNA helicase